MSNSACVTESAFDSRGGEAERVGITIDDLPYEILDYIFCFLSIKERLRTELVCKRWSTFGTTVRWGWPTTFDISDLIDAVPDEDLNEILPSVLSRFGATLKTLKLARLAVIKNEIRINRLEDDAILSLSNSCPNLTAISLYLYDVEEYQEFPRDLVNIAKGCPKLKLVRIWQSRQLDDVNLSDFLKHCHSLECLLLQYNFRLNGKFMTAVNEKLKGFYVDQCGDCNISTEQLMNSCDGLEGFGAMGKGCKLAAPELMKVLDCYRDTLKILYLNSYHIEASDWRETVKMMQQLTVLSLKYARGVDDELMRHLAKYCRQLHSLNIEFSDVTNLGVAALAAAPSLKVLNVSRLRHVGIGLMRLATEGRLERLYCTGLTRLEDENLIPLAKYCQNFHLLDVIGCRSITNRLVDEFRFSLERGFLKGPVTLYVTGTRTTENIKSCDGLNVETGWPPFKDFNHLHKP